MPGGFMIFFVNETNAQVGRAFGFPDADTASTKSVVVPNGPYRVYAYAWDGASPFQGQVRCGRGDLGAVVFLTGAPATVTIDMSMPTCNFDNEGDFGLANQGLYPTPNNFDTMSLALCDGSAYPSCTAATAGTWYVKVEAMGGAKPSPGSFFEMPEFTLTSGCSAASGTSSIATVFRFPLGGTHFSPPARVRVFDNATCSGTASGTYTYPNGLKELRSQVSGANSYLDVPSASNIFYLKVNKYF